MCGTRVFFVFRKFFKMFECKSEVPYVITLERELSQMPLKMRFLDVKQVREGELQYFYAVIANFRHARRLVEEGVRQNPAFVQNGENVAKAGQIGEYRAPHTFSEISKIFAAMAGVSRIGVKNWVDGRVDGNPLGKPASPCAPGVSAGRHRVDMGGFEQNGSSKCTKKAPFGAFSKGLIFRFSRSAFFRTSDRSIRPFRRCAAHGNRCRRSTSHICVPCRRGGPSLRAGRSASAPTTA